VKDDNPVKSFQGSPNTLGSLLSGFHASPGDGTTGTMRKWKPLSERRGWRPHTQAISSERPHCLARLDVG
jgi:hypothetical protein